MSKLCGVCHLDSRPVSYEDAARVRAGLNTPTYVGAQEYREPGVLMGCAVASHSAPTRDLYQPADRSCCSWDGRLDNRKELLLQTGLPADCADSTIALGLYQHKGVDGLRDLMGDWSLCIWDANRRTVVLASDYAGIRPLTTIGAPASSIGRLVSPMWPGGQALPNSTRYTLEVFSSAVVRRHEPPLRESLPCRPGTQFVYLKTVCQ